MRKYLTIVTLFIVLIILFGGCTAKSANTQTLLQAKGLELVNKMDKMAESEEYVKLIVSSTEIEEIVREIADINYSKPNAVYKVTVPKGTASSLISTELKAVPEEFKTEIEKRIVTAISSRINARMGSTTLAACSLFESSDNFIHKGLDNNTLYIYLYEGKVSALVAFISGNENIVAAKASFVINDSLNGVDSDSEMSEWLKENAYLVDCKIEKVELGK